MDGRADIIEERLLSDDVLEASIQLSLDVILFFFFFFKQLCHVVCEILVSQPRVKFRPSAVKVQSPNHWNFPLSFLLSDETNDHLIQ